MNRKLKKLLGAVVATVAAVGTMMAINAVSTFAATATWSWQTNTPAGVGTFDLSGGSTTINSNVSGISITVVDPGNGSGLFINGNNISFKNGAYIDIPVKYVGDVINVIPYNDDYNNYSVAGVDAENGVTEYVATKADKDLGYVRVLSTTKQSYLFGITLEQNVPVTASECVWDFTTDPLGNIGSTSSGKVDSNVDGVALTIVSGGIQGNNGNGVQIKSNATIKVPVFNAGDIVEVTPFSGYVDDIELNGTKLSVRDPNVTSVTADGPGYVEITSGSSGGYIKKIKLTINTAILNGSTSSNKAAILAKGTQVYVVALVPASSVTSSNSLTVTAKGNTAKTIDTVYKSVIINGVTYKAKDLGGAEGDYVYGFEVVSANRPGSLATVQDDVTVNISAA